MGYFDKRPPKQVTPSHAFPAIGVKTVHKWVRIIVCDVREGKKQLELVGQMDIPITVWEGLAKTNWMFDELQSPLQGVILDAQANGVNIVFPVVSPDDVKSKEGKPLMLEEIKHILLKYHPTMKVDRES